MKILIFAAMVGFVASATTLKDLPASKIPILKTKPCTFIHVWATWCAICLKEMPHLIEAMKEIKQVSPIIIDVSSREVQKGFSKKWMEALKPPFPVFFKPGGNDKKYFAAVDKIWPGALPYSALYHKGKQQKVWIGQLDIPKMKADIVKLCQ